MNEIPFVAFGNEELKQFPEVSDGDLIKCPNCKKHHKLKDGRGRTNGGPWHYSTTLLVYKCGKNSYLGAIYGKRLI